MGIQDYRATIPSYAQLVAEVDDLSARERNRQAAEQARIDALAASAVEPDRQSMREIVAAVAQANGLTVADLMGRSREGPIAWPRQRAYMLCAAQGVPIGRIARYFDRDHSTILQGIRQAQRRAAK